MHVGVITLELFIPASQSLKGKRSVIKSAKDRIANKFNVSVAEVDYTDLRQRSLIGVAMVSNDPKIIEKTFQQIELLIEEDYRVQVINSKAEFR
ncbi:MAG: DUF503 domain-containing protein [bacterium]